MTCESDGYTVCSLPVTIDWTDTLYNRRRFPKGKQATGGSGLQAVSVSVLRLLYAHLDMFLHDLLSRVIYLGEAHVAENPTDDTRIQINAHLVHTAMEQIGLVDLIPNKQNRFCSLEPFPTRHLLPQYSTMRDDGTCPLGLKWADEVEPSVSQWIIDPAYGKALHGEVDRNVEGDHDDDGLETDGEDLEADKAAEQLEQLQDKVDNLRDRQCQVHLQARYNLTDQATLSSTSHLADRPWFGERFDWSTFEGNSVFVRQLKREWMLDQGWPRTSKGTHTSPMLANEREQDHELSDFDEEEAQSVLEHIDLQDKPCPLDQLQPGQDHETLMTLERGMWKTLLVRTTATRS